MGGRRVSEDASHALGRTFPSGPAGFREALQTALAHTKLTWGGDRSKPASCYGHAAARTPWQRHDERGGSHLAFLGGQGGHQ
eukprot:10775413-Prorocentrum_lima.AAC.1